MIPMDETGFSFRVDGEAMSRDEEDTVNASELMKRGASVSVSPSHETKFDIHTGDTMSYIDVK